MNGLKKYVCLSMLCYTITPLCAQAIEVDKINTYQVEFSSTLSESGYETFLQNALNAAANEKVYNPFIYEDFVKTCFKDYRVLSNTYKAYLFESTTTNAFIDYGQFETAVVEKGGYMERAYSQFVDFFPQNSNAPSISEANTIFSTYVSPITIATKETSPYGVRGGLMHYGTDVGCEIGTPVYAASDGIAYKVGPDSKGEGKGGGRMIFIKHPDGNETRYMHLDTYLITPGEYVQKGQLIGLSGNTGETSGKGHLHLELLLNGEWIDSDILFKKNPFFIPITE